MRSKYRLLVAGVALVAVVAAACSGGESSPPPGAAAAPAPVPTPQQPKCPLRGTDAPTGLNLARPAVAVKIENSPAARPQAGLERADVVYEEVVEGGITRFMAIFHCADAHKAGPVRSARFDDPKIALPFTRILAFSGANSIVERELANMGLVALDEDGGDGLYRVPAGVFQTHNLFADTRRLRSSAGTKVRPPRPVFEFGDLQQSSKKARHVRMNFLASNAIEYKWQHGAWARFEGGEPFMTAAGKQIAVPNVLIQEVDVNPSPHIADVAGNRSPDITLNGRGRAFLFRDGRVVKGTWKIKKDGRAPVFVTRSGEEFVFAPGPVWVELVPSARGAVKGSIFFSKKRA